MNAHRSPVSCFAHRVGQAFRELHHATRMASEIRLRYALPETDSAPDTYAEFLLRTSPTTHHEPAARARSAGHRVR